ncbi:MAG: hypothetical protein EP343_03275 [Deltaproteobacteria bacterium]|nr:MAG: hypothetical protein EP343_03275 [Deltaproteobacteria bacterium]
MWIYPLYLVGLSLFSLSILSLAVVGVLPWLVAVLASLSFFALGYGAWFLGRIVRHAIQAYLEGARWRDGLSRLSAAVAFLTSFTLGAMVWFLACMTWWVSSSVTTEQQIAVQQRIDFLQSLRLTSIHDQKGKRVGVFRKLKGDWSLQYESPDLLQWRLSRAIQAAEGPVKRPGWWWRLLPGGGRLQCEPFSLKSFLRVPYYYLQDRKVGASTPALQAAKNLPQWGRKASLGGIVQLIRHKLYQEMPRAYVMCQHLTPRDMMATYMNTLWSGHGENYGAHRMSLAWFGQHRVDKLSWNQVAVMAASLPSPGYLNPWFLRSCRKGSCENAKQARVFGVWKKRIRQIKKALRGQGVTIPDGLPSFRNGLKRIRTVTPRWKKHDIHLHHWIEKELSSLQPNWRKGSQIHLHYDRALTTGTQEKQGLIPLLRGLMKKKLGFHKGSKIQASFVLVDTKKQGIVSQYGGEQFFDFSMAQKPVVGSTIKVVPMLLSSYWPKELPLVNGSRANTQRKRRFLYHPKSGEKFFYVGNAHKMKPYLSPQEALVQSANIAFVFLSLRWSWFVPEQQWLPIFQIGLQQMLVDKGVSPKAAGQKARKLMRQPRRLANYLRSQHGYEAYLKNLRRQASFEVAKVATVKYGLQLLRDNKNKQPMVVVAQAGNSAGTVQVFAGQRRMPARTLSPLPSGSGNRPQPSEPLGSLESSNRLEPRDLANLIDLESWETDNIHPALRDVFESNLKQARRRFSGRIRIQTLAWSRELRMEIGLRYMIHLLETWMGYKRKESHLKPVGTLALGVHNSSTKQQAALASFFATGRSIRPHLVHKVEQQGRLLFKNVPMKRSISLFSRRSIEQVRRAMRLVLLKGTAASSGRWLRKHLGSKSLRHAGAKTGTTTDNRGVSCIGFVGRYAGAFTLSHPNNEPLYLYRKRKSWTRQKERWEKRIKKWNHWRERWQNRTKVSKRKRQNNVRYCERKVKRYKEKLAKWKALDSKFDAYWKKGKPFPKSLPWRKAFRRRTIRSRQACYLLFRMLGALHD